MLSHLVPADEPEVTEQMWLDAARPHFEGMNRHGQGPDGDLDNAEC